MTFYFWVNSSFKTLQVWKAYCKSFLSEHWAVLKAVGLCCQRPSVSVQRLTVQWIIDVCQSGLVD